MMTEAFGYSPSNSSFQAKGFLPRHYRFYEVLIHRAEFLIGKLILLIRLADILGFGLLELKGALLCYTT